MPQGDSGTDLTNLMQARTNLIQQLRDMTQNPRPDYSLDGQSLSPSVYQKALIDKIQALNVLIELEGGPFEFITLANSGYGPYPFGGF